MPDNFIYILRILALGAFATVWLTLGSLLIALCLGLGLSLMRLSPFPLLSAFARSYLELFRNVPILAQLFIIYYGLARLQVFLPGAVAALVGLGLNGAAIMSEIFRSAIKGVENGQADAASAIGLTGFQRMRWILLPQALRTALPSTGGFAIGLMKDTSLASAVSIPELAFRAKLLIGETYQTNLIFLIVGCMYMAFSLVVAFGARKFESSLTRGRARVT